MSIIGCDFHTRYQQRVVDQLICDAADVLNASNSPCASIPGIKAFPSCKICKRGYHRRGRHPSRSHQHPVVRSLDRSCPNGTRNKALQAWIKAFPGHVPPPSLLTPPNLFGACG
jgi:hypothetical protein